MSSCGAFKFYFTEFLSRPLSNLTTTSESPGLIETQIKRQTADHPDEGHQHRVEEDVGEDGTPGIAKQDG